MCCIDNLDSEFYNLNDYKITNVPMQECTLRRYGKVVNLNFDSGNAFNGLLMNDSTLFSLPEELNHLFPSNAIFGTLNWKDGQLAAELVLIMSGSINIWNWRHVTIPSATYGSLVWILN